MLITLCAPLLMAAQETLPIQQPQSLKPAAGRVEQPVELGQIRWRRDFEKGLAEAKQAEKPVLLLFQEVPG